MPKPKVSILSISKSWWTLWTSCLKLYIFWTLMNVLFWILLKISFFLSPFLAFSLIFYFSLSAEAALICSFFPLVFTSYFCFRSILPPSPPNKKKKWKKEMFLEKLHQKLFSCIDVVEKKVKSDFKLTILKSMFHPSKRTLSYICSLLV